MLEGLLGYKLFSDIPAHSPQLAFVFLPLPFFFKFFVEEKIFLLKKIFLPN
jgi:hypothetical protein